MQGKVARTFYKILMRAAKLHDRQPALKGILAAQRLRYYDRLRKIWLDVNTSASPPEALIMLRYFSTLTQGGVYYLPEVSCMELVRKAFKQPDQLLGQQGADMLRRVDRLDIATACIRVLEGNIAKGRELNIMGQPPMKCSMETPHHLVPCKKLQKGTLLVAHPLLVQSALTRSIILLIQHDASGSYGLVVNRPVPFTMGDVLDRMDRRPASEMLRNRLREELEMLRHCGVMLGGPVGVELLSILHPYADLDLAAVRAGMEAGRIRGEQLRLVMGHAGWGPGQLEGEVLMNSWLALAPPPSPSPLHAPPPSPSPLHAPPPSPSPLHAPASPTDSPGGGQRDVGAVVGWSLGWGASPGGHVGAGGAPAGGGGGGKKGKGKGRGETANVVRYVTINVT